VIFSLSVLCVSVRVVCVTLVRNAIGCVKTSVRRFDLYQSRCKKGYSVEILYFLLSAVKESCQN